MVKYKLITKERYIKIENHEGERFVDYINDNQFQFESGKVYGIIGEHGEGGEIISSFMSGRIKTDCSLLRNSDPLSYDDIKKIGWYVGKKEFNLYHMEISARKALKRALKCSERYENMEQVIEEFGLTEDRLDLKISWYSGERMRVSLAIGYASNKKLFCFPWMNSNDLYHIFQSTHLMRFFDKLRADGCIVIIPTCRKEAIENVVDEIIEIANPEFKKILHDEKQD